jgi:hypothetical protein
MNQVLAHNPACPSPPGRGQAVRHEWARGRPVFGDGESSVIGASVFTRGSDPGRPPGTAPQCASVVDPQIQINGWVLCPPDCCGSWWTPWVAAKGRTQIRPITTARGWGEVRAAHPGRGNHARATGRHLREGARRRVARVDEVAPH